MLWICFQIAYKLAREQFAGRMKETFLVLEDDSPTPEPALAARRLSLESVADPRRDGASRKHLRSDSSMESSSNPKKADQSRSTEKSKDRPRK